MSSAVAERSADWCVEDEAFFVCGTRMKEVSRESLGERWCFRHRARHGFFFVVTAPDGFSYYGPSASVVGPHRDCTDVFPGRVREWDWSGLA